MLKRTNNILLALLVLALVLIFAGQALAQEGVLRSLNLFPVNEDGKVDQSASEHPVALLIDPSEWQIVEFEQVALMVHKDALKNGSNFFVAVIDDEFYLLNIVKRGREIFIRGARRLNDDEYVPQDLPEIEAFPA